MLVDIELSLSVIFHFCYLYAIDETARLRPCDNALRHWPTAAWQSANDVSTVDRDEWISSDTIGHSAMEGHLIIW